MALSSQQPRSGGNPYLANSQYRSSRKARSRFGKAGGGAKAIGVLLLVLCALTAIGFLAFRGGGGGGGSSSGDRTSAIAGETPGGGNPLASTSSVGPTESPVRLMGGSNGLPASSPSVVLDMSGRGGTNPAGGAGTMADRSIRSNRLGEQPPAGQPAGQPSTTTTPPPATSPSGTPGTTPATQPSIQPSTQPGSTPGTTPGMTPAGTPGNPLPPQATSAAQVLIAEAERQQRAGQLVQARATLNKALMDRSATASDRTQIRRWLTDLNQSLVFSPTVAPGDTLSETYSVQSGDSLERISRKLGLTPDWRFIQRINNMSNPNRISVGQKLKVMRGPFHAVVSKSAFRVDIYQGEVPSPTSIGQSGLPDGMEPNWTYITSFPVGLGEQGSTPLGNFVVKHNSKLVNPAWVNPRTGEKFAADDPKNPIGERWVGIEGFDQASQAITGYGLHGTIDPDSIGSEKSMGCVRLADGPVEIVYEMLAMKISVVKIVP